MLDAKGFQNNACTAHITKRIGTRFKKIVKKNKGKTDSFTDMIYRYSWKGLLLVKWQVVQPVPLLTKTLHAVVL